VLYEIADLSTVWVVASVHERDVSSIKVGQQAMVYPGHESMSMQGKVDLIEPAMDEATRTTRVRLIVNNFDYHLRPGQYGEVQFAMPSVQGLFVPADSVIHTGDREYVFVAGPNDHFEPIVVRTGVSQGGRTQILEGLKEGDRVVSRGTFMLDSESRLHASISAGTP
jgi:Cu(I)/Ag(I) efflux system membrane fusion protein